MRSVLLTMSAFVLMSPASAIATQVLSLTLEEMTDRADVIVRGTVIAVASERVPGAPGRIHTLITVESEEVLLSDKKLGSTITLSVPGGTVGRIGQLVAGAPKFRVGQEILVLLSRHVATRRLIIVGFSQGRYLIERVFGRAPTVVSDRKGLALMIRREGGGLVEAPISPSAEPAPLAETLLRIRDRVSRR